MNTFISPSFIHSTNTVLIKVTNDLHITKSSGQFSGFILFDLLLAFNALSSLKHFLPLTPSTVSLIFLLLPWLPLLRLLYCVLLSSLTFTVPHDSILDCFFTP